MIVMVYMKITLLLFLFLRCAAISHIPDGVTETYNCEGMVGRVINVKLESSDPGVALTICELEAHGGE